MLGHWAIYARSDQIIAGLDRAVDPNDDGDAHDAARVALVPLAEPFAGFTDGPEARAAAGALALDTLVVAPAGNDGPAGPGYGSIASPGGAPAALTVGAVDLRTQAEEVPVALRNGLQLMQLAGDNVDTVEQARTMMERQLSQLVRLVDDLMDLSRINRGKIELRRERVQLAALNSLGTLGDVKAMAVLEKFASASKESPQRSAAEKALTSLRDSRKSSVELGNLRNEVLSLQKENRDLRKEFDDLKKRIEAALPEAGLISTNKAAGKRRK